MTMFELSRQPKLLGFAGHRNVSNKSALAASIKAEVISIKEELGRGTIAISSAAAGADLIFLRACVELRIPTIVILPFPEKRFEKDFDDPAEWTLAQHLMSVALVKYVICEASEESKPYQKVSGKLVEWADAFLFAWDGTPPRGPGGTGETVEEARDLGIPARVIDTSSLKARWTVYPDAKRKARHGFETRQNLLDFLDKRFR